MTSKLRETETVVPLHLVARHLAGEMLAIFFALLMKKNIIVRKVNEVFILLRKPFIDIFPFIVRKCL